MRTKAERLDYKHKKLNKRKRIMQDMGLRGGTLFERHVDKIEHSLGYVADGNIMHYANGSATGEKTRDRDRYGKVERWKHCDGKRIESMKEQLKEHMGV